MKTNDCFHFYTRLHQTELLGKKARNLVELLRGIKGIPDSSIYHHTRYLSLPTNKWLRGEWQGTYKASLSHYHASS
jgi:hypothetical protein